MAERRAAVGLGRTITFMPICPDITVSRWLRPTRKRPFEMTSERPADSAPLSLRDDKVDIKPAGRAGTKWTSAQRAAGRTQIAILN